MPKLVVAGPPGGQATSVCELLAAKTGLVHVVGSRLAHELARLDSSAGKQAKGLLDAGQAVPDELMLSLVKEKLTGGECTSKGWVLEGYPTTAAQARAMQKAGLLPTRFLHIELSDAEATRRLTGRRIDDVDRAAYHIEDKPPPKGEVAARVKTRAEDEPPQVAARLRSYRQSMAGVLAAFGKVAT